MFPQIEGLGQSSTAIYYGIQGLDEAEEYLCDETLRKRLNEMSQALLDLNVSNAVDIFGSIDALKLKSCMTLFLIVDQTNSIYKEVLNRFFNGEIDSNTINLMQTSHYPYSQ